MCTLTYLLTDSGYELFFNRDEQVSRVIATPPEFHLEKNAIYPIDPLGKGTWIAVNQKGMSLVLLNYYQAMKGEQGTDFISRGQLIVSLLSNKTDPIQQLAKINLRQFQPFQICIFNHDISKDNDCVKSLIWNGNELVDAEIDLPITSSSKNYQQVKLKRQEKYNQITNHTPPTRQELTEFHYSNKTTEQYSVNMIREDARTVSISHIKVGKTIQFDYFDNINHQTSRVEIQRDYS